MYSAVLFDLDGTLLDTRPGVMHAVERTLEELGLKLPEGVTLESFVGPPMQWSFAEHFGMGEEEALAAANRFRAIYAAESLLIAEPYPGALQCLSRLRANGLKVAVVTNKSHDNAMGILGHFGFLDQSDYAVGSDMGGKLTKADLIRKACVELGVVPEACAYVGDSQIDLDGARANGMDFVGVSYGFGFRAGEGIPEGAKAFVGSMGEVCGFVLGKDGDEIGD